MIAILFTAFMFISTLPGGLFAIKQAKQLHHILGFTAGIIISVLAFDILPEMFEIIHQYNLDPMWAMIALVAGFLAFHMPKSCCLFTTSTKHYGKHRHPPR